MKLIDLIVTMLFTLIGGCALYIASTRVRTTRLMQDRIFLLIDGLEEDAKSANISSDPIYIRIVNGLNELAVCAPAISGGLIAVPENVAHAVKDVEPLIEFFKRNSWVIFYIAPAFFALMRLQFHGRPLSLQNAKLALTGWFLMKFMSTSSGTFSYAGTARSTALQVEKIVQVPTHIEGYATSVAY